MLFYLEKIVLDTIIQNLLILRTNYARRFLHTSPLSISSYTIHLFGKLGKRKLQRGVTAKLRVTKNIETLLCEIEIEKSQTHPNIFL